MRIFKSLLPMDVEYFAYRKTGRTPLLNPDFSIDEDSTLANKFNLQILNSLDEGLNKQPDLIVIANPTACHYEVAKKAADREINIFIEKPFSNNRDGFEDFERTVLEKKLFFCISYQRRFHPLLKMVREFLKNEELGKVISAEFNVGSYVPAWHPYENFQDLYACRRNLGGGVLLTEIHEIDLCYWYFGWPESVYCVGGNYSDVKMDVEDTAHLTLSYSNFAVQVNLCFMQKHCDRSLRIVGTKGYVHWNQDGNSLIFHRYESNEQKILCDASLTTDDMFISQANYLLKEFKNKDSESYLDAAKCSLSIVEAAKESMTSDKATDLGYFKSEMAR